MLQRALPSLFLLLLLAACQAPVENNPNLRSPHPPAQSPAATPSELKPSHPPTEYTVRIESEPAGAVVVVDGIPVGKAPHRLSIAATPHGFCRESISIKVRFVASDADHSSQTVEEILTPLDKIPGAIRFTPAGTSRVARP